MPLSDYRTSEQVDVTLVEPFAGRLLELLERFAGRVLIVSGVRTFAEQAKLYEAWVAGTGNLAARPGTSNHEQGRAADLRIDDSVTWRTVHAEAEIVGLRFPIPSELWHVETDPAFIPKDDDMTPEQMAQAFGGRLDEYGRIVVNIADGNSPGGRRDAPLGALLGWTIEAANRIEARNDIDAIAARVADVLASRLTT